MDAPTRAVGSFSFAAPVADFQVARSGDPEAKGAFTMRGHAAVFNRLSHDLGGFKTRIKPGFFTQILDSHPDVHLNREHDMRMLLARTKNGSLELREDPYGLHVWSRWSRTALAEETAILMGDGVLDQMSFACDIGADTWTEDQDGLIIRDLVACAGLYDAALCAQGAFPQTSAELVASLSDASEAFDRAKAEGRIVQPDPSPGHISVPKDIADLKADIQASVDRATELLDASSDTLTDAATELAEPDADVVDLAEFKRTVTERYAAAMGEPLDGVESAGALAQILTILGEYASEDEDVVLDPAEVEKLKQIAALVTDLIAMELAEPADEAA